LRCVSRVVVVAAKPSQRGLPDLGGHAECKQRVGELLDIWIVGSMAIFVDAVAWATWLGRDDRLW